MMKKLKFLALALIMVLTCVGFASCGDDDKDEPANDFSVVGIWDVEGADEAYDFRQGGHGIFYSDVNYADDKAYQDYFDYDFNQKTGDLVIKWHDDNDWTSEINGTMNVTVKIISSDKVTVNGDFGYTITLVRRK